MRWSCQRILAQFVCENYEAIVVKYFEGDWLKYADFFFTQLSDEKLAWEANLYIVAKRLFMDLYGILRQVNPMFGTTFQTVGQYRPRN